MLRRVFDVSCTRIEILDLKTLMVTTTTWYTLYRTMCYPRLTFLHDRNGLRVHKQCVGELLSPTLRLVTLSLVNNPTPSPSTRTQRRGYRSYPLLFCQMCPKNGFRHQTSNDSTSTRPTGGGWDLTPSPTPNVTLTST